MRYYVQVVAVAPIIRYNICTAACMHPATGSFYKLQPLLRPLNKDSAQSSVPLRPVSLSLCLSIRAFTLQLISRRRLFVKIAVRECLNATRIMLRWPFAIFHVIYSRAANGFHFVVAADGKKIPPHNPSTMIERYVKFTVDRRLISANKSHKIFYASVRAPSYSRVFIFSQMSFFSFSYSFSHFLKNVITDKWWNM